MKPIFWLFLMFVIPVCIAYAESPTNPEPSNGSFMAIPFAWVNGTVTTTSAPISSSLTPWETKNTDSTTTSVMTTEQIPGANCICIDESDKTCQKLETRKYQCTVTKWLEWFQKIFASIIKYFIYIVMLTGVAALVGLGIAWSIYGSADEHGAKALKSYAINFIIGLTILFLFSLILRFLAPWVYN